MTKSITILALALVLAVTAGACAQDVTASDEYQSLEPEITDLEQQLSDSEVELSETRFLLDQAPAAPVVAEVPAEVLALLDEWWAANERRDGSVVDLYTESGYHLYGDTKIELNDLASHLNSAMSPKWITEPYLIVDEQPRGRYVVTRGMKAANFASAVTFEVLTMADGELKLAQTAWTYAH